MKEIPSPIVIGKITGAFGIKGWVKIRSYTDPEDAIFKYTELLLVQKNHTIAPKVCKFDEFRAHNVGFVAKLASVNDRNEAEILRNAEIVITRNQLAELQTEEYYFHDLIGLNVKDNSNTYIGKVKNLMSTGANDILVINSQSNEELLVPFLLNDSIIKVDLDNKEIVINWQIDA